jgi:hypothetical protein
MFKCPHCGENIPNRLITAHSGRVGGKKTAKRGSDYFRKIAAMRKDFKGGRPPKEPPK